MFSIEEHILSSTDEVPTRTYTHTHTHTHTHTSIRAHTLVRMSFQPVSEYLEPSSCRYICTHMLPIYMYIYAADIYVHIASTLSLRAPDIYVHIYTCVCLCVCLCVCIALCPTKGRPHMTSLYYMIYYILYKTQSIECVLYRRTHT